MTAKLVISNSKWASLNCFIRFAQFACVGQFSPVSLFYTLSKTRFLSSIQRMLATFMLAQLVGSWQAVSKDQQIVLSR